MPPRRMSLLVIVGIIAVLGVVSLARQLGAGPEREAVQTLYARLRRVRADVDACRTDVAGAERRFHTFDRRVDSLRAAVRAFESDAGEVPSTRYAEYLAAFERYNAAVPLWRAGADSLRTRWFVCQERAMLHNRIADSLSALTAGMRRR